MVLLRRGAPSPRRRCAPAGSPPRSRCRWDGDEVVVEVRDLVRRFGAFTAVDQVSFEVRERRDLRSAGPQRRRQDHHVPHAVRPAGGHQRRAAGRPARTCGAARRLGAQADRLRGAEVLALRPALGRREPRFLRQRLRPARRAATRAHRLGDGAVRARPATSGMLERPAGRRLQAAPGHGRGAAARARRFCSSTSRPAAPIPWPGAILAADHRPGAARA